MRSDSEYERRVKAIGLLRDRIPFGQVLREVQRGRFWLPKWSRRFRSSGLDGLRDQSRTSKHLRNKTGGALVRKILALRDELTAHKTRRAAFAGIGAGAIHFELQCRGVRRLPAISPIEKILARAGKTKKIKPPRCADLRTLRRTSDRFLGYYHLQKPCRSLTPSEHGTRFPGVLRDRLWSSLRHLPDGFSLDRYSDGNGHLALP